MSKAKPIVLPAFSDKAEHWADINWRQVHCHVRGLQVRIAKATKAQDWRRVKALQRLLTRSFAAKVLAVRRVTENRGKNTAGVDKALWNTPAYFGLSGHLFRFHPARRFGVIRPA